MKKKMFILLVIFFTFAGIALISVKAANAQEPIGFTLPWSVIGSGGMGGSAGGYTIHSTLGQPVVGSVSGGDYTLTSGFWGQALMEWFENFLPLIIR